MACISEKAQEHFEDYAGIPLVDLTELSLFHLKVNPLREDKLFPED